MEEEEEERRGKISSQNQADNFPPLELLKSYYLPTGYYVAMYVAQCTDIVAAWAGLSDLSLTLPTHTPIHTHTPKPTH
jgi:hypothetical protein